ncbi:MAG TPA: hypothetical protein VE971_01815 [Candidatus Eisenbacteria bacterium]|nr:hypothetical protein [Candidatus Eisenbacteria bacterium]
MPDCLCGAITSSSPKSIRLSKQIPKKVLRLARSSGTAYYISSYINTYIWDIISTFKLLKNKTSHSRIILIGVLAVPLLAVVLIVLKGAVI